MSEVVKTKSVRLNASLKTAIKRAVLEGVTRFKETTEQLNAEEHKLAMDIYVYAQGDDLRKIKRAPKDWFHHRKSVSVSFNGTEARWCDYTRLAFAPDTTQRFTISNDSGAFAKFDASHEFSTRYFRLKTAREENEEAERKLELQVSSTLSSCTTTGKLIQAWPEIEDIVNTVVAEKKPMCSLPVLPIKELNKALGFGAK